MAKPKSDEAEVKSNVAPIESIEPVQEETESGPVSKEEVVEIPASQTCWNCNNHGKQTKLENGVCPVCGFDKSLVYNLDLEAEKHAEKQAAINATK